MTMMIRIIINKIKLLFTRTFNRALSDLAPYAFLLRLQEKEKWFHFTVLQQKSEHARV